jgi:tRNA nucleotidyltransferase/poly(A) polymerase
MLRFEFMLLPIDTNIFPQKKGIFIVGGSIRDLLQGRRPIDYDLAVKEDPVTFAWQLAARIDGHVVQFGQHGHTVLRVVDRDNFFDILPVKGDTIEEDLLQRDFTINAMALDVSSGNLIDPAGGRQDLSARKIRMVAGGVFRKDPVRLVRAYRMAVSFGFTIDPDTETAIMRDADLITRSAAERIRDEFFKILESDRSHVQLERMAHSGLLFSVFPELQVLKNYHLPGHKPNLFFDQTLASYGQLENLCAPGRQIHPVAGGRLFEAGNIARSTLLKWSALFHSIGKPAALIAGAAGALQFSGYAAKSAALARTICQRLKFSRRQTDQIQFIVRHHCRPHFLFKALQKKAPIGKAFIRFFMKCGDFSPDILLLALAIFESQRSPDDPATLEFSEFILARIEEYDTVLQPRAALPSPLNGNDLIREFGLKPSAKIKHILKHIEQERLSHRDLTREQALEVVQNLLKRSETSQE